MGSRRFTTRLALNLALLVAAVGSFAWLLPQPQLAATKLIAAAIAVAAIAALWHLVQRTNRDVARFVTAMAHRDTHQSFRSHGQGSGFDELGGALNDAIARLRDDRARREAELRFAAALADGSPAPLLAIAPDGTVERANVAARRLFALADGGGIESFAPYGPELVAALHSARPRRRQLCRIVLDGVPQRAILSTAEVERLGRPWRIVAAQVIQGELDAAEIAVQSDLVRVLTHEIMNSMTPVTSLAETVASTIATLDPADGEALEDARTASATLARRSAGIMHFVDTYRAFTRAPTLSSTRFAARPWAAELARLFEATPAAEGVSLEMPEVPPDLRIDGDPNLLAQMVLNLLKNAAEAAREHGPNPVVRLEIGAAADRRARILVADNGPGIPPDRREEVFLPFYTTKRTGTGVGLSFARQIVLLHKGSIGVVDSSGEGAAIQAVV